ncbi:hypothetical protein JTE90_027734 [Oedothorax gibbosus]|uniref:Mediator of RNA polymerase II transcription subunit 6 n=1 Tax=Oedothorax gibbosus TaxID=931172 RepID=A0AAV6UI92_9ARAC|nr:hypothetical protein JTE90_027734 [Oedothorax gibbosus]
MNQERFLPGPMNHGLSREALSTISWHDSAWIPILNPNNVMDYFAERTNPFYDRTCNNENLKMQRLGTEHLTNMVGIEYCLLHVQDPILYVIRKQHRFSPTQTTPMSDYYIIAGVVYQAPDLANIIGSRLVTMVHQMQGAFDEAVSYSHYHPSKGYWWEFKDHEKKEKVKTKEEPGSAFQRRRVDVLLSELAKKFPPKMPSPPQLEKQTTEETVAIVPVKAEAAKTDIKSEKPETPPAVVAVTSATVAPVATLSTVSLPPPPPPPPVTIKTEPGLMPQRNVMKPPPEKKMRLA